MKSVRLNKWVFFICFYIFVVSTASLHYFWSGSGPQKHARGISFGRKTFWLKKSWSKKNDRKNNQTHFWSKKMLVENNLIEKNFGRIFEILKILKFSDFWDFRNFRIFKFWQILFDRFFLTQLGILTTISHSIQRRSLPEHCRTGVQQRDGSTDSSAAARRQPRFGCWSTAKSSVSRFPRSVDFPIFGILKIWFRPQHPLDNTNRNSLWRGTSKRSEKLILDLYR